MLKSIINIFSQLQLSMRGKVVISFLMAGVCVFLAWVVMHTVFKETLKTVESLSVPDHRQFVINRIIRSISNINQLQYVQYNIETTQGAENRFMLATDKLKQQLDSLSLFNPGDTLQQKRIDSMHVLIDEHRKVYSKYIRLKADIIKNKTITRRLQRLGDMLAQSSLQVDSNIITSRQKKTTITEPEIKLNPEAEKSQGVGFFSKLFGRKPKNETILKKTIIEEYDVRIDTLSLSQQDSLLRAINRYMAQIRLEQNLKGMRFVEKERDLLASSNTIVNKLFALIGSIKDDETALAAQQKANAAAIIDQGLGRLSVIVSLFFGSVGLLSLLIMLDITRNNKYKAALQAAKNEAERLSEIKQRFLSNMSHEIRTPLQSILGFSEQAKKHGKAETETIDAIYNSSTHLLQIVNEVLDYSRITSGKFSLKPAPFSLQGLLNEVEEVMNISAAAKNLVFGVEYSDAGERTYIGDVFRLKQILYNLIGNAIKFTEKGFVRLEVIGRDINDDETAIVFTIQDTGIGISKQQLERVFNEFEQADTGIAPTYGGTGLGLAIVKELVQLMGGQIVVESKPGIGSVFTLTIPFKKSTENKVHNGYDMDVSSAIIQQTVWLADDDAYIRKVCSMIFETHHIPYKVFASAAELLNEPHSTQTPLYVLDIRMPHTNGLELCRLIRQSDAKAKVIALTAQVLPEEHAAILDNGFNAVLTKPFAEKQLLDMLLLILDEPNRKEKFNLDKMVRFALGDQALLAKNIDLLVSESANDIALITLYTKSNDATSIADVLHRLAGRVGVAGAAEVSAELRQLEKAIRDSGNIEAFRYDIETACTRVSTLIGQLQQEI